jgi:hypothetical protein
MLSGRSSWMSCRRWCSSSSRSSST